MGFPISELRMLCPVHGVVPQRTFQGTGTITSLGSMSGPCTVKGCHRTGPIKHHSDFPPPAPKAPHINKRAGRVDAIFASRH